MAGVLVHDAAGNSPIPLEPLQTARSADVHRADLSQAEAQPEEHINTPTTDGHELQDQTNLLPPKQLLVVFAGLSCALFCSMLDQTIVSTILPTLGRDLGGDSIISWVGTSYLLTSTAFQPIYGRLSDVFGRGPVLVGSMVIFLIGSILCAVSQNVDMLISFRAFQGIGGGGVLTTVQAVVSDVVTLQKRGTYEGILGSVVSVSNACGPLVGGVLVQRASWRWCFYINIPLTSMAVLVTMFGLPLKRVEGNICNKLRQIDYAGCALLLASAALILLPISWGGSIYSWSSAGVLAPLLIGVALIGAFIYVEKVAKLPIIQLSIFKNPTVFGVLIGGFFTGFVYYANLYYLPQFFQVVRNASPITSGVLTIPLVVSQTLTSMVGGILVSKTGNYLIQLKVGYVIWSIASGLFCLISPSISNAKMVGFEILSGIGSGSTLMTGLIAIQACLPRHEMAVATSTRNFLRLLGGSISLAACSAILNNTIKKDLSGVLSAGQLATVIADPTKIRSEALRLSTTEQAKALLAYTRGIRNIFYFMIPCCAICLFITIFFVKGHRIEERKEDQRLKEQAKEWVKAQKARKTR